MVGVDGGVGEVEAVLICGGGKDSRGKITVGSNRRGNKIQIFLHFLQRLFFALRSTLHATSKKQLHDYFSLSPSTPCVRIKFMIIIAGPASSFPTRNPGTS